MARRKKSTKDEPIETENTSVNADDNFGLPDIDYKPLERHEEPAPEAPPVVQQESSYTEPSPAPVEEQVSQPYHSTTETSSTETSSDDSSYTTYNEYSTTSKSSPLPRIIGVILVIVFAAFAAWYFLSYKPAQEAAHKAEMEQARKKAELEEQARKAEQLRIDEDRRRAAEEAVANAKPKEGTIETLSERTKRYYVVAASSIDADLIMDYAKKLSMKGVNIKIIPPYGKVKFSRLTIAESDTYADAQKLADSMKGDYTDALWVVKY